MGPESFLNSSTQPKSHTPAKWVRLNRLLLGGFLPLFVAIAAAILLSGVGMLLRKEVYNQASRDYQSAINSIAEQKVRRVLQWIRWHELQLQDWGRRDDLRKLIQGLEEIASTAPPSEIDQALSTSMLQKEIDAIFQQLSLHVGFLDQSIYDAVVSAEHHASGKFDYSIWNRYSQLLATKDFDHESEVLGRAPDIQLSRLINHVFDSHTAQVELRPVESPIHAPNQGNVSPQPPDPTAPVAAVLFAIPIYLNESDFKPSAALIIQSDALRIELEQILGDLILRQSNCYFVTTQGIIATPVLSRNWVLAAITRFDGPSQPSSEVDKQTGNYSELARSNLLQSRDPGANLLTIKQVRKPHPYPLTKSAQGATKRLSGQDFEGYRDYRGQEVVGAWRWVDRFHAGLVLEIPYDQAYANLNYINRSFSVIIAVPILTTLGLIAFSLLRYWRRNTSLENQTLGAYVLGRKIGEGGLGVVYLGEHKMLGRQSAIKVIKPKEVSADSIRRFEREVRLASSLQHPKAVSIYDFDVAKDGTLYCAMELVNGVTLAELIQKESHLPLPRIIHILQGVCSALEAAHRLQLIHRDIKPQNIMIGTSPEPDTVKVVDFGLAKNVDETIRLKGNSTRSILGTPGFLAPERIDHPEIANAKVDLFSFGVLGLYLIASQIPPLGVTRAHFDELIANPYFRAPHMRREVEPLVRILLISAAVEPVNRTSSLEQISLILKELSAGFH